MGLPEELVLLTAPMTLTDFPGQPVMAQIFSLIPRVLVSNIASEGNYKAHKTLSINIL